jgi:hypothetical protein
MSNTSPQSLFLKTRGRASAFRRHAYSSGVKSSVSIRISPPSLNLPYRRKRLARLLGSRRIGIVLSDHTDEDGTTIFLQACKMGLEGIVSKPLGAPYRSGPSRDWLPYPASNHPYRKVGCRGQDAARRGRGQGAVGGDAADAGLQLPGDRCQKHRWLSPAERTRRTNDRGPRD